eukprot:scaffold5770_cov130-Isochrysis_galbana.AAC.4
MRGRECRTAKELGASTSHRCISKRGAIGGCGGSSLHPADVVGEAQAPRARPAHGFAGSVLRGRVRFGTASYRRRRSALASHRVVHTPAFLPPAAWPPAGGAGVAADQDARGARGHVHRHLRGRRAVHPQAGRAARPAHDRDHAHAAQVRDRLAAGAGLGARPRRPAPGYAKGAEEGAGAHAELRSRVPTVRSQLGLLLLQRGGAREDGAIGAQVGRRQGQAHSGAQAQGVRAGRDDDRDQPEGHRPARPGHAGQGGHPSAAPRQAPQHGAHYAGVRWRAGAREAAGVEATL